VTWKIVGSLMAGGLLGRLLNVENGEVLGLVGDFALAALLFAVGFSLGADADLGRKIKGLPKIYLAVPFLVAAGSLIGAVALGLLGGVVPGEAALVGAGFGWYSLSAVLIAQGYDLTLGTLALLTNVFREFLAILLIPAVARRLGKAAAVAPGGATAMDVTLPIIAAHTDSQTAILAFYSGTVLSALVPVVIPFILQLLQS